MDEVTNMDIPRYAMVRIKRTLTFIAITLVAPKSPPPRDLQMCRRSCSLHSPNFRGSSRLKSKVFVPATPNRFGKSLIRPLWEESATSLDATMFVSGEPLSLGAGRGSLGVGRE